MPEDRHSGVPGGGGNGPNVKSGLETGVMEDSGRTVVFNTPFPTVPHVVVTLFEGSLQQSLIVVSGVTASSFEAWVQQVGGGGKVTRKFHWIATDAGDP